jgi:6-phosphogluconolactonase/glucosamine-6-phosphate isomerase/deaminase
LKIYLKRFQEKNGNEEEEEILPRVLRDFDLNEKAGCEFDLNKFPEEGEESSKHEFQPLIRKMLRRFFDGLSDGIFRDGHIPSLFPSQNLIRSNY